ncbi:MAG: DUF3800 domain-containing protein [Sedimentibacter sp.]
MRYDLYCDESRQDLIVKKTSINKNNRYICIGGIMMPTENRETIKEDIKSLKRKYEVYGELKWGNVSENKIDFYLELIDLFFNHEREINFRTVIIDAVEIDNDTFNESDHELGYYKFYYQLLYHWINRKDTYFIFTDYKTNKDKSRLKLLKDVLNRACNSPCAEIIQAINSKESLILQLQNVLMGAVGYKYNYGTAGKSSAKQAVVNRIEEHLGHEILPTVKSYKKFNIFKINLRRGRI